MASYACICIRSGLGHGRGGGSGTLRVMKRVELRYELVPQRARPAQVRNPMLDTLAAIRTHGSISGAARVLGYSFRHVWNQIKAWELQLGHPLTSSEQGQGASLSPFAEKLLWTERLAQARLAPQIEALRAELERCMALAFDEDSHVLPLYASHDDALPLLQEHAAAHARLHLDVRYCGSVDAIRALNEGRCAVAGFHVRAQADAGSRAAQAFKGLLQPGQHKLMGFAWRSQGLMLRAGNPLGIASLHDAVRQRARWANRTAGSGTRLLLDDVLAEAGLSPSDLVGYEREEPSHAAVAQAVVSGEADVGLGIASTARQAGLDFVPLLPEVYHLVCLRDALETPAMRALRQLLHTPAWQMQLATLAGCLPHQSGEVQSLKAVLPWWQPRRRAAVTPEAAAA